MPKKKVTIEPLSDLEDLHTRLVDIAEAARGMTLVAPDTSKGTSESCQLHLLTLERAAHTCLLIARDAADASIMVASEARRITQAVAIAEMQKGKKP